MHPQQRQGILDQLTSSEAQLLSLVQNLTPGQWSFRESPERWSIADILEHLAVFEDFIRQAVETALTHPPDPSRSAAVAAKEPLVLDLATSRGTPLTAREATRPTGRWHGPAERIARFRAARARTLAFAAATGADLRSHYFAHVAFGDLDCYQWLLVLSRHTLRHILQIEEIMAHPGYPAPAASRPPQPPTV